MDTAPTVSQGLSPEKKKKIVAILQDWYKRSKDASWLHGSSFRYFRFMNHSFMIPIILLSSASGAINLAVGSTGGSCAAEGGVNALQIIIGVMSMATAAGSAIYNFMKIPERQERHDMFSYQYDKLAREILVESTLLETDSQNFVSLGVLLRNAQEEMDRLGEKAPPVPGLIERRLEAKQKAESNQASSPAPVGNGPEESFEITIDRGVSRNADAIYTRDIPTSTVSLSKLQDITVDRAAVLTLSKELTSLD
jgi:hypothetical protein